MGLMARINEPKGAGFFSELGLGDLFCKPDSKRVFMKVQAPGRKSLAVDLTSGLLVVFVPSHRVCRLKQTKSARFKQA